MNTYKLTQDEINTIIFIGFRYIFAEIIIMNLDENGLLTIDNMTCHDLKDAIENEGIHLLDNRSQLFNFLISLEAV